jgi:hypothetical protein
MNNDKIISRPPTRDYPKEQYIQPKETRNANGDIVK